MFSLARMILWKVTIESLKALIGRIDWQAVGERMWTRVFQLAMKKIAEKTGNDFSFSDADFIKRQMKHKRLKVIDEGWE